MKSKPRQFNLISLSIWIFTFILSTFVPSIVFASEISSIDISPQHTNTVILTNFDATPNGDVVQLIWSTREEQNTISFQVFRGTTSDFTAATLVTNSSVSSLGENGGDYEFIDTSADVAIRYLYWLSEQQSDGGTQIYGPTASLVSSSPSAISLADFSATLQAEAGVAQVQWQTSSEMNTQGFWVLRSTTDQQEDAVRVNSEMIVSNGSQGGNYEYQDTSILADLNYTYWIEEQEQDGTTHIYNPITLIQDESLNLAIEVHSIDEAQQYRVMLPIIIR